MNTVLSISAVHAQRVEAVARLCAVRPQAGCPLVHRFTPGLYIREIFMPKGTFIISRKHLTTHPFVVSKGHAAVLTENGVQQIKAPFCGITEAGTQRILFIHEDCVWTTFHVTTETDPEIIVATVTEKPPFEPGESHSAQVDADLMRALKTLEAVDL